MHSFDGGSAWFLLCTVLTEMRMAETVTTMEEWKDVKLGIFKEDRTTPAQVDGVPVWASSDETVVKVTAAADGMSAVISSVAPSPVDPASGNPVPNRITVTADADKGTGVTPIVGVTDDIIVTLDPRDQASVMTLTLGAKSDK